jgi:hypothetical protein
MKTARFPANKDRAGFDFAASEDNEALVRQLRKRPVIHAAFSVDACAWPVGHHRHGSRSSIRLMG